MEDMLHPQLVPPSRHQGRGPIRAEPWPDQTIHTQFRSGVVIAPQLAEEPGATKQPDGQITSDFQKCESSPGIKNIPLNPSGKSVI
jgi:hypothetical protein